MLFRVLTLTLFAQLIAASPSISAVIASVDSKDGKTRLNLDGEILPGDATSIKTEIKKANDAGRLVVTIRLNSTGGNLVEAIEIAEIVRQGKIATAVLSGAKCASACFIIFAAGNEKYAHYSASIGVHGASDSSGRETVVSGAATVSMARVVRELGVPPGIIGKMVVTPPDQMVWLSPDDLRTMGISMLGKPSQLAIEQQPTSQLPAPTSIVPSTKAAESPLTWKQFTDSIFEISSTQNNGRPRTVRACQPELGVCTTGILIKKDGKDVLVKVVKDPTEKIVSREICEFNSFNDVRTCSDWDTGRKRRDMKNTSGEWYKVSDE